MKVRALWGCVVLCLCCLSPVAHAGDLSPRDADAIRKVVAAQLEAFTQDDADRAFALASAGIRRQFGTPQKFMEMVRSGYPVVYRPGSVRFEKATLQAGTAYQPVHLSDTAGRGWLALYPMQRQPDGSWRIDGCSLARLAGQAI